MDQYQPPSFEQSSDAIFRGNRNYNNRATRPNQMSYWDQVSRQKYKHYNDLTSYLCIVFCIICIARAVAIGIQTSEVMSCPTLPTYQIVHIINYGLWALLFISSCIAIKFFAELALKILFGLCCLNMIYKIVITVIIGLASDLLGSCFLVVNFKTWTWVFGLVECFFFGLLMFKIKQVMDNLTDLKR